MTCAKAEVFLQPGELFFSAQPARVKTVVGSCVAIMIRTARPPLAAIAHCLLPESTASFDKIPRREALRYVDSTVDLMLRSLRKHGAALSDMEVKVFGGSDTGCGYRVGLRNVQAAKESLARHGLAAIAGSVGGEHGRAIQFDTETGDVLVKTLHGRPRESR